MKLKLSLHKKQLKIFRCNAQVIVLCAGRGFGKSVLMLTRAIAFCFGYREPINPISPQVALIAMPTLKMARAIHWLPLLNIVELLPVVERVDKSDFRIIFKGERPDLIVRGADRQGDRLRGLNLCFAGLDEFQDFDPTVWDKVLEPALNRNKNWRALVIGTPKGKATHFYKFHLNALKFKNWQYFHFTSFDNPFISRRSLRRAEAQLPPKVFRQEYRASWEDFDGQLLPNIAEHHKADAVPASFKSVLLGCDWGDVNPCLVVIGVTHRGEYYLIDYWQNTSGVPVTEDEVKAIAADFERQYGIYRHFLPDDRTGSILAFRRYGKQHGLSGMQRSVQVNRGKPGIMERALIVNSLFYQERLFFAPKCHELYDLFASYHRDKDAQGNLLSRPAPGQNDHPVDAAAYVLGRIEGIQVEVESAA
jgi:hypothetical protein